MGAFRAASWAFLVVVINACGGSNAPTSSEALAVSRRAKPAVQQAAQTAARFEQLVAQQGTDPVGTLVTELRATSGVATATLLGDQATVLVTMTNGSSYSLYTADASRPEWQKVGTTALKSGAKNGLSPSATGDAIDCTPATFPQSKKACLITGYQQEFQQSTATIQNALKRAKFEIVPLSLKTVQDLKTMRDTLSSCGVIYISSHGEVAKDLQDAGDPNSMNTITSNHVLTEIQINDNEAERQKLIGDLASTFGNSNFAPLFGLGGHKVIQSGKSVLSLSSAFFSANYPNSFVYVDTCSSDAPITDPGALQLRAVFEGNGAGAVLGWDGPFSAKLGNDVAAAIFQGLSPGVSDLDSVQITITPPSPGAGKPYTPSATISPAIAGVELRLSISGTDGFTRSETALTDPSGNVTFAVVPGGAGGVTDTVTVVAGGANNSATAFNVLQKSPLKDEKYILPWRKNNPAGIANLKFNAQNPNFNLVCNNAKLTKKETVVKF